jgi:predicted transcriptional regulator
MKSRQKNFRLPTNLVSILDEFCTKTRRRDTDIIRAAIELFFADGLEAAERRLSAGLWDADQTRLRELGERVPGAIDDQASARRRKGKTG